MYRLVGITMLLIFIMLVFAGMSLNMLGVILEGILLAGGLVFTVERN